MEFEWDEAKDAANRAKHGVGLGDAARMEWKTAQEEPDLRFDYRERRTIATGLIEGGLFVCVFTLRNGRKRIIFLRKANSRERRDYGTRND